MKWKNWPYWLKGGVIGGIIPLGGILIGYLGHESIISGLLYLLFAFPVAIILGCGLENPNTICSLKATPFIIILSTIIYFLLGAIIGWIVGKIKNKKK